MQSKFWAGTSSSSESEYDETEVEKPIEAGPSAKLSRWLDEESSSEESQRMVRATKDRRWDAIRDAIRQLENHIKIDDYQEIYKDFDYLMKCIAKASAWITDNEPPKCLIRSLGALEQFIEGKNADKEALRRLTKAKATAFNTLRAKVRKANEEYREQLDEFRADPEKFDSESEGSSAEDSDKESVLEQDNQAPNEFEAQDGKKGRGWASAVSERSQIIAQLELLAASTGLTSENITKALQTIWEKRGRRNLDRGDIMRNLRKLAILAQSVDMATEMEVLGSLFAIEFEGGAVLTPMSIFAWNDSLMRIKRMCEIVMKDDKVVLSLTSDERETEPTPAEKKEMTAVAICAYAERLDDEMMRSLQPIDIHSELYRDRLLQTNDMISTLWMVYCFFQHLETHRQGSQMASRLLEHLSHRQGELAEATWRMLDRKMNEMVIPAAPSGGTALERFEQLAQYVFQHGDSRQKIRGTLHLVYQRALNNHYQSARDLIVIPNMMELAVQTDISTQVLYNRALAQLGLCAWRKGLIADAHACLAELCSQNRQRELLAQGMSSAKLNEKTLEQEKEEQRRILPYHLHLNLDELEIIHNICAMLLEVPHIAQNPLENKKRPISKHFRRLMENFDRQLCSGIPENNRDVIVLAAKALQKGDWSKCAQLTFSVEYGSQNYTAEVKGVIINRIKQEAMKTYIFAYQTYYDALSVDSLAEMFELSRKEVYSIISKMMINEELEASWDESSSCIFINNQNVTKLQNLALELSSSLSYAVEMNEQTLNMKSPKFALTERRLTQRETDKPHVPWNRYRDGDTRRKNKVGKFGYGNYGARNKPGYKNVDSVPLRMRA